MRGPRGSRIVRAIDNVWTLTSYELVERWVASSIIRIGLIAIASLLALSESVLARTFDWSSRLLSSPCGVYAAHESAVVIIGGDDGLGQTIALSFSELGYTVFVLYPASLKSTSQEDSGHSGKSTNVSSLLYLWHKKKEGSSHRWGLVAPISLDTQSGAQRAHASETIHAYCVNHSLKLVSLIVLPPPLPTREKASSRRRAGEAIAAPSPESLAVTMWGHDVGHSMMEPVLVAEDYIDLLSASSGRVIMLSTCTHSEYLAPVMPYKLLDGVQQRLSKNLSYVLHPLGIRVCSLAVGPVELPMPDGEFGSTLAHTLRIDRRNRMTRLRLTVRELLVNATVRQEALCRVLQNIIRAKYPKDTYSLGIHPFLHNVWSILPDIVRLPLYAIYDSTL